MPSSELLRYFHAEAAEYLDAMEALLDRADGTPDAGAFVAAARALRGSATMARVPRVGDLALVLERIANGLRDGEVQWSADLRTDLRDTAAELRALVRSAPGLSAGDESRAVQRMTGLRGWLPNVPPRATPHTPPATTTPIFIALQASAIAGDLESFVRNPQDRALLDDVVSRLRSLRGIAGIVDHPPLGEVADAVERALRA
ncbi:MAG TPA: Hpt domain-containing protein, partial [Gemmatimonadaceae bacterium]|nr:Hpt domain-containing protein [Gemmatimonadaceae bacterium]